MTDSYYLNQLIHHLKYPEDHEAPAFEQCVVRMLSFARLEKAKGNYHTITGATEMVDVAAEVLDENP